MRFNSDSSRLIKAAELARNGHHREAAGIYHDMGNQVRHPSEKASLWKTASELRMKHDH